jgi:hypothetical protein
MLRESDNATPDYLLDKLGSAAMDDVIKKHMPGYIDTPKSIGAIFTSWMGTPAAPLLGSVNVADYSGIETFGYRKELDQFFSTLHTPATVQAQRNFVCATLPWQPIPPNCIFGSGITEAVQRPLETGYFPESNTRTYTALMTGLLKRNLLSPNVQAVIEPHLEWRLTTSTGQGFSRYGAKGGSLATGLGDTVITWTAYVETQPGPPAQGNAPANRGVQAVVTIQLRDGANGSNALQALTTGVAHFGDALVLDPAFAATVLSRLPQDPPLPDLIARIIDVGQDEPRGGLTQVKVLNIGTASTGRPTSVSLYLSNTSHLAPGSTPAFTAHIPALAAGSDITFSANLPRGQFLITVVDPQNLIIESDKQNNVQYEKLGAVK